MLIKNKQIAFVVKEKRETFKFVKDNITFEAVSPVDKQTFEIIEKTIDDYLNNGGVIKENEYNSSMFYCKVYFKRNKNNIRVIIPDTKQLFPWDEGCDPKYKTQDC